MNERDIKHFGPCNHYPKSGWAAGVKASSEEHQGALREAAAKAAAMRKSFSRDSLITGISTIIQTWEEYSNHVIADSIVDYLADVGIISLPSPPQTGDKE